MLEQEQLQQQSCAVLMMMMVVVVVVVVVDEHVLLGWVNGNYLETHRSMIDALVAATRRCRRRRRKNVLPLRVFGPYVRRPPA